LADRHVTGSVPSLPRPTGNDKPIAGDGKHDFFEKAAGTRFDVCME
jgi:hypothetical protein